MVDIDRISMVEWIIGGVFFTFFSIAVWRLLRALGNKTTPTHEIRNFNIQSYKHKN